MLQNGRSRSSNPACKTRTKLGENRAIAGVKISFRRFGQPVGKLGPARLPARVCAWRVGGSSGKVRDRGIIYFAPNQHVAKNLTQVGRRLGHISRAKENMGTVSLDLRLDLRLGAVTQGTMTAWEGR